ncbi:hypothetical protein M422DRAFT_274262 [Sphaerobolus stellatus SS14]|uniref:Uncharacterized protein n=1 Tax=Sphaerobolus stellatus (strain SS14) TaxID=990650 RepID=A0A0C9T7C1_SPHS4|nr:hypothetical protein M422DRAFT_274262 [Sphaerobolus stellatus SS14]
MGIASKLRQLSGLGIRVVRRQSHLLILQPPTRPQELRLPVHPSWPILRHDAVPTNPAYQIQLLISIYTEEAIAKPPIPSTTIFFILPNKLIYASRTKLPAEASPAATDSLGLVITQPSLIPMLARPHYIHHITFYECPLRSFPMLQLQLGNLLGFARVFASSFRDGPIRGLENAFKIVSDTPRLKYCNVRGAGDTRPS